MLQGPAKVESGPSSVVSPLKVAVLGAGHGGQAMAGHLALLGCEVRIFNRSELRLETIRQRGGIELSGAIQGFGPIAAATADMREAIADAELIMVVVPATGHAFMAEAMAPHLKDGQVIVLNPGRTGGALEVYNILRRRSAPAGCLVAEAQTLLYAARCINPAQVQVFGVKNTVPLAAIPGHRTVEAVRMVRRVLPQFVPALNVLKTSLDNIGAIFHPAITVLNAARIESTNGNFEFYMDGITHATARVLERMDDERIAVAEALGFSATRAREWLYLAYDAAGRTLYEAIHNNVGYKGITAPTSLQTRYLWEDVPMSLVPLSSLGELLGVPTPAIDHIIDLASLMDETDYRACGRTVDRLGLRGLSVRDIQRLVQEGEAIDDAD